ncbi:hypothetical protein PIB30_036663 [Stylosanthes scabra]|uniref:Uncharacterized protein n=1 Tax=Stylosanthes scabra TaxID=79078 RepID=A0ABU6WBZ0_9FABA|nr:hypothetical protein [Stylosanthes scabra]
MGVERVEEEDTHHDVVIVDPMIETTPPKHTIPVAAIWVESVEEEDTHHDVVIVDATIETAPPKHVVPASAMGVESVEEEDTQHNNAIVDASIAEPSSVIEEAALTALVEKITAEDDATFVKTTVEKPLIVQQCLESTSVHKQPVIVLGLEKPGDKESVAVPREPETAELTLRDLADSDEAEMDLVNGMLAAYNHNYFDPRTELPYSITTLIENDNNEGLHYIDKDKMKRARYLFAPVLYGNH